MKLLHQLITRLVEQKGHRVLIFCQFKEMITIIADYLDMMKLDFRRLDGDVPSLERLQAIEEFTEDENIFAFILSTRAGGVGINLIGADTVIIFDSDWNPHQDRQAQDRCHRIGQRRRLWFTVCPV